MIKIKRLSKLSKPIKLSNVNKQLSDNNFIISEGGATYQKKYTNSFGNFKIDVLCDNKTIYDIFVNGSFNRLLDFNNYIKKIEDIIEKDVADIKGMEKVSGSMGPTGGSANLTNINLDETLGGPRWWLYSDMEPDINELEESIKDQFRYNPQYLGVGDSLKTGEDTNKVLFNLDQNIKGARLIRNRQEVKVEVIDNNGKIHILEMPHIYQYRGDRGMNDGDIAQELNKYQLQTVHPGPNRSLILLRKKSNPGDFRGIWEVNGRDAVPGYAYIDNGGTMGSYSLTPELLDMDDWTDGSYSPGRYKY